MQLWTTVIHALQLLAALTMIGLVLIQHGKGADMGASFGSGASGSLFGASGSANFLSRSTAACAAVFFVCTLALAFLGNDRLDALRRSTVAAACSTAPRQRPALRRACPPFPARHRRRLPRRRSACPRPFRAAAVPAAAAASAGK